MPHDRRNDPRGRSRRSEGRPGKQNDRTSSLAICLPADTRDALKWGHDPGKIKCDSRSLLLDRFGDPRWKDGKDGKDGKADTPRRDFFNAAFGKRHSVAGTLLESWLEDVSPGGRLGVREGGLHIGKLQSRMTINMAGGVMENAGLCLDRFSGEPYIPGSAVKGCARRMAIQELLEADGAGKINLLADIALTFGWGSQDWRIKDEVMPRRKQGESEQAYLARWQEEWERKRSDFAYAVGELWTADYVAEVKKTLWEKANTKQKDEFSKQAFDHKLGHCRGSAQFLQAYPTAHCTLGLDILTSHHTKYYAGEPDYKDAPDTEDPTPVIFPAVAAGSSFVFAVIATDGKAMSWLKNGLEAFGIGAKTNAGYGWFVPDVGEQKRRSEEAEKKIRIERVKSMPQAELDAGVAELHALRDDKFREKINGFLGETDYAQPEIRILLEALLGPKRAVLDEIRTGERRPARKKRAWIEAAAQALGVDLT